MVFPITYFANQIIFERKILEDWRKSLIVNCTGKRDSLAKHNYFGLKLSNYVLITIEKVVDSIIRTQLKIHDM